MIVDELTEELKAFHTPDPSPSPPPPETDPLEEQLIAQSCQIAVIQGELGRIIQQLTVIPQLEAQLASSNEQIARIPALEARINELESEIATLKGQSVPYGALLERVDQLTVTVADSKTDLGKVESDALLQFLNLSEQITAMGRLKDRIEGISGDLTLVKSHAGVVTCPFVEGEELDGIIAFFTRNYGINVGDAQIIEIAASSVADETWRVENVADLESTSIFCSLNEPGQWVMYSFGNLTVLTGYGK
jgi:hypothetical protein